MGTRLPSHGQSGSPFPLSWLSALARGAGSGGSGDFGGPAPRRARPRALCGSSRGHARAAPPRPSAGMPRAGRGCGTGAAEINPPASPLCAPCCLFWACVFQRAPWDCPRGRIWHKYVRDPACSSASQPRDRSAGLRMFLFQLVTTPGFTLQSHGVGVPLNHRQPSPASVSQPRLSCTFSLVPPSVPCFLGENTVRQGCVHTADAVRLGVHEDPPLHHQHNEHPCSFRSVLEAATPHFTLCILFSSPKMLSRQKLPLLSLPGASCTELEEPTVPGRQGLLPVPGP